MDAINRMREALASAQTGRTPAQAVEDAVAVYKEAASYLDALKGVQQAAKALIGEVFEEVGVEEMRTQIGKVYTASPAQIVRYDAKGLDLLCEQSQELAVLLEPYRKVSERKGSISIR